MVNNQKDPKDYQEQSHHGRCRCSLEAGVRFRELLLILIRSCFWMIFVQPIPNSSWQAFRGIRIAALRPSPIS